MPNSSACLIVARESESSCGPHPKDQPPPPTAQEPNPTVVILSPLEPSGRVGSAMVSPHEYRLDLNWRNKPPRPSRIVSLDSHPSMAKLSNRMTQAILEAKQARIVPKFDDGYKGMDI